MLDFARERKRLVFSFALDFRRGDIFREISEIVIEEGLVVGDVCQYEEFRED